MAGGHRRQTPVQGEDQLGHEVAGGQLGVEQRDVGPPGGLRHLGGEVHAVGHDEEADPRGQEALDARAPCLGVHAVEIGDLQLADDLHAVDIEIIVKSGQRQPRPGDVPVVDAHAVVVRGAVEHLETELGHDGVQRYAVSHVYSRPPSDDGVIPIYIL